MPPDAAALYDSALQRAQRRVGRVLREKWTLDALLGVGGMASVYAATHRNGKRVAVKVLHPEISADPEIRARFLREGYVANKVGHPGAVSVSDDDIADDGACFLVMDLLDGETLEARRERAGGRLGFVDVMSIADRVLDVLAAAHDKTIVHRDLKPDNLFVTREGDVKVLDFGIARLREGGVKGTHTGISMGTPSYMANEQARGLWDEVDARTDLWAVGATMFACLTGRPVHEGRTINEQLLSAMTNPAPPLRSIAPDVPQPIADVVDTALAFDRGARYPHALAMQQAMRAAYHAMQNAPISTAPRLVVPVMALQKPAVSAGAALAASTGEPVARTGSPRSRSLRGAGVALVAAAFVVVALTLVALALFRGRGDAPHAASEAVVPPSAGVSASAVEPPLVAAPSASVPAETPPAVVKEKRRGKGTGAAVAPPVAAPPPDDPFVGGRHK